MLSGTGPINMQSTSLVNNSQFPVHYDKTNQECGNARGWGHAQTKLVKKSL